MFMHHLRQFNRRKSCAYWHKNPVQGNSLCCYKVLCVSEHTNNTKCKRSVGNATAASCVGEHLALPA